MPNFAYQVRDRDGNKIKGSMESASEKMVADHLLQQGYLIANIKKRANLLAVSNDLLSIGAGVSLADFTMFYFQLANLVDAGIPLVSALAAVIGQIGNRTLKTVVQSLKSRIEGGASLSEAMSHHGKMFPLLYRSMVRVGETSGSLALTLRHIAELNEAKEELRHQVRSALAYPVVLILASISVVVFMMVWIVPTFTSIFNKAGIPLPLPTRFLYGISIWTKTHPVLVVAILIGGGIGFQITVRVKQLKYYWDQFWLSMPTIGILIRRIEVARWSRSLALMLSSGVPVLQALEIAKDLTQNLLFQEILEETHTAVQSGGKVADTLRKKGIFPNDVVQMVSSGENSGTLDKMLYKVAQFYDQLIARTLKKLTSTIEPVFILVMGGVVALIMLSILLPIFDMIKILNPH